MSVVELLKTEMSSERGGPETLKRIYLVKGLSGAGGPARAYNALYYPGLGDDDSSPSGFEDYRLARRSVVILEDKDIAEVTLEYAPYGKDDMNMITSGSTSLNAITTQKDRSGNAITVSYTFPADYLLDTSLQSQTIATGVDLSVQLPSTTLQARGIMSVNNPLSISETWVGATNMFYWGNGAPGMWLCTKCDFVPHRLGQTTNLWDFTFEFQKNLEGWQPIVFFVDPQTSKPPSDLVVNVGVKQITWYNQYHYGLLFASV